MRRVLVRTGVGLTALLCLGTAGHAGQTWWARRIALRDAQFLGAPRLSSDGRRELPNEQGAYFLDSWRKTPWYGIPFAGGSDLWMPRRVWYERLRLLTGQDFGPELGAWEAWFKAHPVLVWDPKLKHLVEPRP